MRSKGKTVNNYVAHRLRQIRVERGLTSSELAQRTGIVLGSYSCLENGWYKINIDNLFKILQALQAKVSEVWPETEGGDGPIDEEYIQQAVEQALVQIPRKLQLDDLYDVVCRAFEVPKDKLLTASRWERLLEARAACGILAKELGGIKLRSLAQSMQITESALSHQMRRQKARLPEDSQFALRLAAARRLLLEEVQEHRKAS